MFSLLEVKIMFQEILLNKKPAENFSSVCSYSSGGTDVISISRKLFEPVLYIGEAD
jgi:hypothetical protein